MNLKTTLYNIASVKTIIVVVIKMTEDYISVPT